MIQISKKTNYYLHKDFIIVLDFAEFARKWKFWGEIEGEAKWNGFTNEFRRIL